MDNNQMDAVYRQWKQKFKNSQEKLALRSGTHFQSLPNLNTHLTLFNVSVEALDESVGVVDGVDDDVGVPGGRGARV